MTKKHDNIEKLDGIADIETDEKYEKTRYYWQSGNIGIAYCNNIDVIDIIENCDLSPVEKEIEKLLNHERNSLDPGTRITLPGSEVQSSSAVSCFWVFQ